MLRGGRTLRSGTLEVDVDHLSVKVRGRVVSVSGLQLRLLLHLVRHPNWVFTRAQLLSVVWGADAEARDPKAVDILVCRLRRRLGVAGRLIESVRSFGYRFRPADESSVP